MSDDIVNIEVDGQPVKARKGQMIIEVTDQVGAYVPRFCYHDKLSIAANCRMCLVEVEKAPKPLPACATPVGEGMKIFTRSPYAMAAQKATMEFLLINHPLDCPICDQGGECELQDLAMGFGRDISRYNDKKRVVKDKDIGPLVSTDMTRCIHCTRCVRFGAEINGLQELGTMGRGEGMLISAYVESSLDHEMSANIIDLCPVGALNNKPYRYSARAWEMQQRETIAPHDCVGSNLYAHVLRGTVKRIVPRSNEAINESWISDRDRFSYEGIYSTDRLQTPRIKENSEWRDVDWETAFDTLTQKLQDADADEIGILASPSSTSEEAHLLARLAEHLGTANIDHRLRQSDFSDQHNDPVAPWLGLPIADIEKCDAVLVVGSNIRKEAPIIGHRLRKAAVGGAKICFVNSDTYHYFFDVAEYLSASGLVEELAGVAVATGRKLPAAVAGLCANVNATDAQKNVAAILAECEDGLVLLGNIATRHPASAAVRALAATIAAATGARFGVVSEGANSIGAHLAGVLPHRSQGGNERDIAGKTAAEMMNADLDVLMLFGVEPGDDIPAVSDGAGHGYVVACTPYSSDVLESYADLLLPIGTYAETSGTFVNCEGRWQSFTGVANPVGAARPGWKVLRVLGNMLDAEGFDYQTSEEIRDELRAAVGNIALSSVYTGSTAVEASAGNGADSVLDIPMYRIDGLVRRAGALQLTPEARRSADGTE